MTEVKPDGKVVFKLIEITPSNLADGSYNARVIDTNWKPPFFPIPPSVSFVIDNTVYAYSATHVPSPDEIQIQVRRMGPAPKPKWEDQKPMAKA